MEYIEKTKLANSASAGFALHLANTAQAESIRNYLTKSAFCTPNETNQFSSMIINNSMSL